MQYIFLPKNNLMDDPTNNLWIAPRWFHVASIKVELFLGGKFEVANYEKMSKGYAFVQKPFFCWCICRFETAISKLLKFAKQTFNFGFHIFPIRNIVLQ